MLQRDLEALLKDMTLEEKIGQTVQMPGAVLVDGGLITGPDSRFTLTDEERALCGSILGTAGAEVLADLQKDMIEKQPHHIPMLFMADVINGFQTIFPIPLAQGCTFRPELSEEAARIAAREAAASGLHVTFSPMVDLVRDARWGRVMESTGEDPYLNSCFAGAIVRGYQGDDLKEPGRLAACLKHFAGYGAPEGGREYENVELSERTFREDYLPAYQAAVDAGCRMAMTSFNTLNRIPSSGNKWLLRHVLREEMGFDGVLISDYAAVEEMVMHGIAQDPEEAARLAITAGVDIDMVSSAYVKHLADLIRAGKVEESLLDEAVMRILILKNDLGLFENPFKDGDAETARKVILCEEHRKSARELACESFVLLKNEGLLPLLPERKKVAFIGPYVENPTIYGAWSFPADETGIMTIRKGVEQKSVEKGTGSFPYEVRFEKGTFVLDEAVELKDGSVSGYDRVKAEKMAADALEAAAWADTVVLCLGEHRQQTGEGGSRDVLRIADCQMELLRSIAAVNPNVVTVLFSGRPIEMEEIAKLSGAVMMAWMPGTEGGSAVADVLFGDVSPQGRLAMCIPRKASQAPVYYNRFSTGRPDPTGESKGFISGYSDDSTLPLFPFGYGLSYTEFAWSDVKMSGQVLKAGEKLTVSVTVSNTGKRAGTETVQLYIRDVKGSVVRPVRSLKGFCKVTLEPGEKEEVSFEITEEMLRFFTIDMTYRSEPGDFEVFVGADSFTQNKAVFRLAE